MINNLSAYSYNNNDNLCSGSACFNIDETALTNGTLNPQTSQTRDGGYSPPPASITYPPTEIDGEDSIVLDNYLSEGSTVSVNISSTTTCMNLATGYDAFNFGYQLLIQNRGVVLDRTDTFRYNNTSFNVTGSGNLISNWTVLSSTARYNKMLSGTGIDRLPVGSYKRTTFPNDIITLNYYLPIEYQIPPIFWPNELLNVYKTKKIVWDMSSIRLGGEDLKDQYIPIKKAETTYIVDQPRDILQYSPNELLFNDVDFSLSAVQLGNTITGDIVLSTFVDGIGYSVDTNAAGDRVVVSGVDASNGIYVDTGVVRVYQLINSTWVKMGQDLEGIYGYDRFGHSVSMNSDGNRIAVGYFNNTGVIFDRRGTTNIYEWNGSQWVQLGTSIRGLIIDDWSGYSVQLNSTGNRVIIAEPFGQLGSYSENGLSTVRVFEYNGSAWVQLGQTISGGVLNSGVRSVSINSIGDIIAFGSEGEDLATGIDGVVRVYRWNGAIWSKIGEDISGDTSNFLLGRTVSLNQEGNIFAVGAYEVGAQTVCVYKYNESEWSQLGQTIVAPAFTTTYGDAISLNAKGDRLAIGDQNKYSGAVEVYEFNGLYWEKIIVDINGILNGDHFGASVSLNNSGDRLSVGATHASAGQGQLQNYDLPTYPLLGLSAFKAYKTTTLWSDGVITEAPFISPFYLPDGSYGSQSGAINFRKFTSEGEYTILSNTFYYKNSLNSERILVEPYNITFVVS